MEKLKKRFLFGDLYNIQAYEEYFADMSRKGLHIDEVGSVLAYFKEGDPEYINYRIDMFKKDEKDIKIKEHRDKGWEFVSEKEPFLIFSAKESSGLEELYETPEEQRQALKESMGKSLAGKIGEALIAIIGIISVIFIIYSKIQMDRSFFLGLAEGDFLITMGPILIAGLTFIRQRLHINRIMRTLESGEFLSHYGNYGVGQVVFALRNIIFIAAVLLLISQIYRSRGTNTYYTEKIKDLPIINMEDIEEGDYIYPKEKYNDLYESWSLFVPKSYELYESVEVNRASLAEYNVSLSVNYYLGRFDYIAKGLESDLLHSEEERLQLKLNKVLEEDNFVCYGGEDENRKVLLCRKDLEVVIVRYFHGKASLDKLMEATIKKLNSGDASFYEDITGK